jgi:hypothetical protein
LFYTLTHKRSIDSDLGYVEVIRVHQEMVRYCERNNLYNEPIAASFNMYFNLRDRELGYVTGDSNFTRILNWNKLSEAKYLIYESTFNGSDSIVQNGKSNYRLIQSFTNKHAWGKIYENTDYPEPALKKE